MTRLGPCSSLVLMQLADIINQINKAGDDLCVRPIWRTKLHGRSWDAVVEIGGASAKGSAYDEAGALADAFEAANRIAQINRALIVIDAAVDRSSGERGTDDETLNALRTIWRYSTANGVREAILWLKNTLIESDNDIGRYQNANAARNRIRWLLGVKAA